MLLGFVQSPVSSNMRVSSSLWINDQDNQKRELQLPKGLPITRRLKCVLCASGQGNYPAGLKVVGMVKVDSPETPQVEVRTFLFWRWSTLVVSLLLVHLNVWCKHLCSYLKLCLVSCSDSWPHTWISSPCRLSFYKEQSSGIILLLVCVLCINWEAGCVWRPTNLG